MVKEEEDKDEVEDNKDGEEEVAGEKRKDEEDKDMSE